MTDFWLSLRKPNNQNSKTKNKHPGLFVAIDAYQSVMGGLVRIIGLLLLVHPYWLGAQISRPGVPPSFSHPSESQEIPFEVFHLRHVAALQAEDAVLDSILDIPWRFGENLEADIGMDHAGVWETLETGDRVWRMGVESPGAYSINLTFNRYHLPPGAELFVYSPDRTTLLGAFTSLNNQPDFYFATAPIPGDRAVIEYVEPAGSVFNGELHLETVTHAYRNIVEFANKFGRSGSCNINVACEEAAGWENQIDAVLMMMVGSNSLCTGTLINNTNFDGRPFVLSANHCYRNPSTLVFWFNYQSETCENPPTAPPYQTMSGAMSHVRYSDSDVWLLELNQPVPFEYNPFYAGWNRTLDSVINETVVSIHHPRGDIKKLSYAEKGASAASYLGDAGSGTSHWRLTWSGGTTTEPSSSGAPLFDDKGRIIGQLHGGYASCSNTLPDWYGRFGISWDDATNIESQLSRWLDPNDTDAMAIDGYRPSDDPVFPPVSFSAETIAPDSILLTWEKSNGQHPVIIAWNTADEFGTPSGGYALGDRIEGGGVVFYLGDQQSTIFRPALANAKYHFRAWSYTPLLNYSQEVDTVATSGVKMVRAFPYKETFSHSTMPFGWMQDLDQEDAWSVCYGNGSGYPATSFTGNYNACFYPSLADPVRFSPMLSSPLLDLADYEAATLAFYYTNMAKGPDQDQLTLYYRTSPAEEWKQFFTIPSPTTKWTRAELALPSISGTYQIGFRASWFGGHGVCLDAIRINAIDTAVFPPPGKLEGSTLDQHSILLEWEGFDPEKDERAPVSYSIYRDHVQVASVSADSALQYIDRGLHLGNYFYHITAVYDDPAGESVPGNRISSAIMPKDTLYFLNIDMVGQGRIFPELTGLVAFNNGAITTLRATAKPGYMLKGWFENDSLLSAEDHIELKLDRDYALTLLFLPEQLYVQTGSLPVNAGVQSGAGPYIYGDLASISTSIPLGWRFLHWEESDVVYSTNPSFQLTVTKPMTLVARFQPRYRLDLSADPPEGGVVSGEGYYEAKSIAQVSATPNPGWEFVGWYEDGDMLTDEVLFEIMIDSNRQLTAVFIQSGFHVSIAIDPPETAYVTGSGTYERGDTVVIAAQPLSDWVFTGWMEADTLVSSDSSYTFVIEADRHFVSMMQSRYHRLIVDIEGKGTTQPEPGTYTFEKGQQTLLVATPARGWHFRHWLINQESYLTDTIELIIEQETHATAVFCFPDDTNIPSSPRLNQGVYPNPGTGIFHMESQPFSSDIRIEVFDLSGRLLISRVYGKDGSDRSVITIDLSHVDSGVYILRASDQFQSMHEMIIKR